MSNMRVIKEFNIAYLVLLFMCCNTELGSQIELYCQSPQQICLGLDCIKTTMVFERRVYQLKSFVLTLVTLQQNLISQILICTLTLLQFVCNWVHLEISLKLK